MLQEGEQEIEIFSLERKQSYNGSDMWLVKLSPDPSAATFSTFISGWCSDWKEGDKVLVNVKKNGKYLNLTCPEKFKSKRGASINDLKAQLDSIQSTLNYMMTKLGIERRVATQPPPPPAPPSSSPVPPPAGSKMYVPATERAVSHDGPLGEEPPPHDESDAVPF